MISVCNPIINFGISRRTLWSAGLLSTLLLRLWFDDATPLTASKQRQIVGSVASRVKKH